MVEDFVADDEFLYRCIFYKTSDGTKTYKMENGKVYVSIAAFRDASLAPSVDRAVLCEYNPTYTQKNSEDGVVSLISQDVRLIDSVVQKDSKGRKNSHTKLMFYLVPYLITKLTHKLNQRQLIEVKVFLENCWNV